MDCPVFRKLSLFFAIILLLSPEAKASLAEILRFEHYNTARGLSQNTATSILCDSKGYLWIGTNNGLNRFDGNKFRVFMNEQAGEQNFSHNRIVNIWEDARGFIWFETHDAHYHYFDPVSEKFQSLTYLFPELGEGHAVFNQFMQYSDDEVWIGLSNRGVLRLIYQAESHTYKVTHYTARGSSAISNNNVAFIESDRDGNIWIGTHRGLTFVDAGSLKGDTPLFNHLFISHSFSSIIETATELWFGTKEDGILKFQKHSQLYTYINVENSPTLRSDKILKLHITRNGRIMASFYQDGMQIHLPGTNKWSNVELNGVQVESIYEDRAGKVWIATEKFGITGFDLETGKSEFHQFLDPKQSTLPDTERHIFYEDSNNNLWIGTHEGALNLYDRSKGEFVKYMNDPKNSNSISSNIVMCITEDHSGQLWVGTGQFQGGLEKVILKNPAFEHLLPQPEGNHISDNIVRAVIEDPDKRIWAATKAGRLHVFDEGRKTFVFDRFVCDKGVLTGVNIYTMMVDKDEHLWLGSKGKGILVSHLPLTAYKSLSAMTFVNYQPVDGDSTSLSHINIYSLAQDSLGRVWAGTYGKGLNMALKQDDGSYRFMHITTQNSGISSDLIRNVLVDSHNRVLIASVYGLNVIEEAVVEGAIPKINSFYSGSEPNSLALNDITHIYEDGSGKIWLGTYGAGVNVLDLSEEGKPLFQKYDQSNGLSNSVVYGILGDESGHNLWFSTENGLSRFNRDLGTFESFTSNNGLNFNSFSENTCFKRKDGTLLFGGFMGLELVDPSRIVTPKWNSIVELTDFQLFNKEVPIGPDEPLKKSIAYTNNINLKHFQSSFSFEFSSMDYMSPDMTQYAYLLENFDEEWRVVTAERKAIYTNLSPGEYIFRVKSTNRNGQWADNERALYITIMPPWYKTRWAYMLYSVLIAMLIFVIVATVTKINRYRNDLQIERRVNDLKLRFFTNISHEIRTPLTLIIGPIEDMLKKDLNNGDKPKLELIRKNGTRMLQLTNQLLDFRKIQNNKMTLYVKEFDIVEFTRGIFDSFAPLATHKNIVYSFYTALEHYNIWADPSKLDTVIYNLLSNALKFTDAGKKVRVAIKHNEADDFIEIQVEDEGCGIEFENLSRLFERYTILSGEELAGTGIGLSLSNELARLHHGEIVVVSELNQGSIFTLRLPSGKEHFENDAFVEFSDDAGVLVHSAMQPEDDFSDFPAPAGFVDPLDKRTKIMVVEDNREIAEYICQSLSPEYFSCIAGNGEEAINMLSSQNPDLIISDVMMPVMDGMEMTRAVKENFATSHIPVVLLTAKSSVEDHISGAEHGADAYIVKPFNASYLKAVVNNLIEQRKAIIAKFRDNKTIDPSTLRVNSKDEEFLRKLISFVEDNHTEEFSIEQLANEMCVSRTVFYNKVKGLTGMSPVEFVRQLKLKVAAHLLTQGYNVSEAAMKVGFNDARYFSRQFKALFGHLPSKHLEKGGFG